MNATPLQSLSFWKFGSTLTDEINSLIFALYKMYGIIFVFLLANHNSQDAQMSWKRAFLSELNDTNKSTEHAF